MSRAVGVAPVGTRSIATVGSPRSVGNSPVSTHVFDFLHQAREKPTRFDLAVIDPPSFYTVRSRNQHFDIAADHPALINSVAALMRKNAVIYFSTNHQDFSLYEKKLKIADVEEITECTIPEDYQNKRKKIHRCWKITI